ncbi:MAG: GDP-mannose 4,6-dehydratase [Lentisphaeria bacterium]|nr:GDP-mannose 4,6-dehydratase [Lentisphaeria bacterium]
MNILITGGAGFIGSHLAESWLKDGHSVSVIDDLSTGSLENLKRLPHQDRIEFVKGNVITSRALPRMIQKADVIYHLAAAVGVELVVHDPIRTIETNVSGTSRILKLASKYGGRRLFVASTSEVYGKSTNVPFHETDDLIIGPSTHSRWSYACSKLIDEFLLMAYHRSKGLPGTVTRFFNTVGPRQTGRYGMVIPRFVSAALQGKPLRVYGTGKQTRCFCHVSDTVRALRLLADCEASFGQILNIGSTNRITIRELAETIVEQLHSTSEIVSVSYDEAYEVGFEDMLHRAPDCTKIGRICGWKAELPLERIISDVAGHFRSL